jgi:hypothetical protein
LREPDWRDPDFWRWAIGACKAQPAALGSWFTDVGTSAWVRRKQWAKQTFTIDFPSLDRSNAHVWGADPPDGWPEMQERVGVPETAEKSAPAVELTTEEKVARDREVAKLKAALHESRAKYGEANREAELEERICEAIDRRIAAYAPVPVPTLAPRSSGRPESVVALMSDYHIGEVVSFEETGGLNAYDFDVFMRRYQYHIDAIGGICFGKLTGYDFPELVIAGLGDMVSGIIHDELVETSDSTLMDWLIDGSHIIAQGIRQLAAEFPSIRVEWHFGNHGRVTQKPRFKRRWVNYDYLLGHMISVELRDQANVTFTNHKSFWSLTDVQGHGILCLHGDNIKGWSGIPLYGVNRAVSNLAALLGQQRQRFDTVCLGHFHQTALLERIDADVVLNGSGIGGNEYSYGALFAGNRPRQVLFGVHPDRGRTWQYAVDLSNGDAHECRFTIE